MKASSIIEPWKGSLPVASEERIAELARHNATESERAIGEERAWRKRLHDSPLGKTQQDFVAYYEEVMRIFKEWFDEHGVPIPK